MKKIILITGATDGIGLETAKSLASKGHQILIHGRSEKKLEHVSQLLTDLEVKDTESYIADFSVMSDVVALSQAILKKHTHLDVIINNAGIFKTENTITPDNLDIRFAVNTLAPFLLTKQLLPVLTETSRVVNLSSAAQAPVNIDALLGKTNLPAMDAYAQSKLAITMWSRVMGLQSLNNTTLPKVIAVNPGSLLASKMVKEGFGVAGNDLSIGVDILIRASLSGDFDDASGKYFDNDSGRFSAPHPDALDDRKTEAVLKAIEQLLENY